MAKKPTTQYFTNVPDPSTPEGQAYAAAQAAFDLQLERESYSQLVDTDIPSKNKPGTFVQKREYYPSQIPVERMDELSVENIEKAYAKSREASQAVDQARKDSTRISPAYWVTQTDFQDTFGRRYNPMNPQDQRDFFSLVQNAPGATRRTDVAGADVGAVIASRQRPESLPTYQDIGGVKVPENALGYTKEQQQAARLSGFKTAEQAQQYSGTYSEKPRYAIQRDVDKNLALDRQMNLLGIMRSSQKPSKKEELPYSEREGGPLEDPKDILKYIQQYAPETLTPEQKAALGMQPELSAEPYAARAGIEAKKPTPPTPPLMTPGVDVEGPPLSARGLSQLKRDAQEEVPQGYKSWSEYNDAQLNRIRGEEESQSTEGLGAGRREPSALEQGIRAVQAGQQFGQNLVGAAVGQGKKAMDKVSSIAKAMVDKQRRAGMAQAIGVSQPHGGMPLDQQQLLRLWSLKNPGKTDVTVGELEEFGKTIYTPTEADVEEFGQGMEVGPADFNVNAPSAATQQIMRQMGGRGTAAPLATPTGTKPLTRGRFEFDSELPSAVKSSIDRMSAMPQVQTTQPLTKISDKAKTQEKRKTLSFTYGMSDAEVSAEYEKIFGREGKNLPIEVKKDMIERYRLGEMAESGAIFGGDPMYEMEIDPNTGELKLNPKSKK